MKTITALSFAALVATAGVALAQGTSTAPSGSAPSAASTPIDPAAEAKFKALDKDGKGMLEGAALDTLKPVMTQVDTNKDGKVSRDEFAAAFKSGVIK